MTLTDLCDTNFKFDCQFEGDAIEYWDFSLTAEVQDYKYYQSLNNCDIEQLRENCKRILKATEGCINEGY